MLLASLKHIADAELFANSSYVYWSRSVSQRAAPCDDYGIGHTRQIRRQALRKSIGEGVLRWISAQIGKREDDERSRLGRPFSRARYRCSVILIWLRDWGYEH